MQVSSTVEEHGAAQKPCSLPRLNLQFSPGRSTPRLSDPSGQPKSKQTWARGHSSPAMVNTATLPAQHSVQRGVSSQLHWKLHTNYSAYYLSGSLLHSRFPSAIGFSLAVPQRISRRCLHVPFAKGTLMATLAPYGYTCSLWLLPPCQACFDPSLPSLCSQSPQSTSTCSDH